MQMHYHEYNFANKQICCTRIKYAYSMFVLLGVYIYVNLGKICNEMCLINFIF